MNETSIININYHVWQVLVQKTSIYGAFVVTVTYLPRSFDNAKQSGRMVVHVATTNTRMV